VDGEGPAPGERIAAQVYHQYAWHTCEITAQRVTAEPQWKRVYLPLVLKRR